MNKIFKTYNIALMIKQTITDNELREHIASLAEDGREIFLLEGGKVRLTAVAATEMCNQMRVNHKLGPLETYILGQAYVAGALLQSTIKGNDRIRLEIECGGPVKGISIESWAGGAVRGYLLSNPIKLEKPLTSLDTSLLYGPGFLTITKILEGSKTPFTGQIMLEYGNLANDLALYFQQSEQTPTLFYLSLHFDEKARLYGAGGLFIQAMPGAADDMLEKLQNKAKGLTNLSKCLSEGMSAREYVENEFAEFAPEHLERGMIGFSCPCSKSSFEQYLHSLPENEKKDILEGKFPLEVECFNCGSVYSFTKEEAVEIMGAGK